MNAAKAESEFVRSDSSAIENEAGNAAPIPFIDQEDDPVTNASKLVRIIVQRTREIMDDTFDQRSNLREMMRYLECFGQCESRKDVENRLDLSPMTEASMGGLSMTGAVYDTTMDLRGIWALCLAVEGQSFVLFCSIFIFLMAIFIGIVRIAFIGKECFNLRKAIILGLTKNCLEEREINLVVGHYKYQWIINAFKAKWIKESPSIILRLIQRLAAYFLARIFAPVEFVVQFYWRRRHTATDLETGVEIEAMKLDSKTETIISKEHLNDLIHLIDECFVPLPIFVCLNAPSIPLHWFVINRTRTLEIRCKDDASWINDHTVLRLYCEAAFLHFVKFSAAEMTKTELFVETIPQLILRTIGLTQNFISNGAMTFFTKMDRFESCSILITLVFTALQMVLPTLKKMEYYFIVYGQGDNFVQPNVQGQGVEEMSVVKTMPTYGFPHKAFCILAHTFAMSPIFILAAATCCSSIGPLPLLLLVLAFTWVFWLPSPIPTYDWYYTWTCTLSTLSYTRTKFDLTVTFWELLTKLYVFGVATVVIFLVLMLEQPLLYERTWNLFLFFCGVLMIYLCGTILLFLDRVWWKVAWGRNFYIYTEKKNQ